MRRSDPLPVRQYSGPSCHNGVLLLAIYSLGLGVPFLLAALFTDALASRLRRFGRVSRILRIFAGAIMILMGVAMISGSCRRSRSACSRISPCWPGLGDDRFGALLHE